MYILRVRVFFNLSCIHHIRVTFLERSLCRYIVWTGSSIQRLNNNMKIWWVISELQHALVRQLEKWRNICDQTKINRIQSIVIKWSTFITARLHVARCTVYSPFPSPTHWIIIYKSLFIVVQLLLRVKICSAYLSCARAPTLLQPRNEGGESQLGDCNKGETKLLIWNNLYTPMQPHMCAAALLLREGRGWEFQI